MVLTFAFRAKMCVCVCEKIWVFYALFCLYTYKYIYANWVNALEGYGGLGENVHHGNWHFIEREQQKEQMRTAVELGAVSDI